MAKGICLKEEGGLFSIDIFYAHSSLPLREIVLDKHGLHKCFMDDVDYPEGNKCDIEVNQKKFPLRWLSLLALN